MSFTHAWCSQVGHAILLADCVCLWMLYAFGRHQVSCDPLWTYVWVCNQILIAFNSWGFHIIGRVQLLLATPQQLYLSWICLLLRSVFLIDKITIELKLWICHALSSWPEVAVVRRIGHLGLLLLSLIECAYLIGSSVFVVFYHVWSLARWHLRCLLTMCTHVHQVILLAICFIHVLGVVFNEAHAGGGLWLITYPFVEGIEFIYQLLLSQMISLVSTDSYLIEHLHVACLWYFASTANVVWLNTLGLLLNGIYQIWLL